MSTAWQPVSVRRDEPWQHTDLVPLDSPEAKRAARPRVGFVPPPDEPVSKRQYVCGTCHETRTAGLRGPIPKLCCECRLNVNVDARAQFIVSRQRQYTLPSAAEIVAFLAVRGTLAYTSPLGNAWVKRDGCEQHHGASLGEAVREALNADHSTSSSSG